MPAAEPTRDPEADRLMSIFGLERELLVTGRLDQLPKLEAAKTEALVRIATRRGGTDPAVLKGLRTAAASNQRLYEAALLGVRRIADQIASMVSGGGAELRTYSADGGRRALMPGPGKLEHRA